MRYFLLHSRLCAHVQVSVSGWPEGQAARDVWRSITEEFGEQSAMITSTTLMLPLPAIVLDSGWY